MRPQRLELDGFTAFREPVTVDFAGADLFALVGPTGAGKSSIIDALCFALYGSVPRLDRRSVAPVISAGALQARVRLDFTVGTGAYTATRVVRRTAAGGATTKEARLEAAGEVLAGNADEVTKAVEAVLGIGFEQFTTCVVLPQGEFARFLHDTPRDRQELLVRLLELGLYADMRSAANQRKVAAESAAELTERHAQSLAGATTEALAAAVAREHDLEELVSVMAQAEPDLVALAAEATAADAAAAAALAAADRTAGLAVPGDLAGLAEAVWAAEEILAAAQTTAADADTAVTRAEETLTALPAAAELAQLARAHTDAQELRARIAKGEPYLAEAAGDEARAAARLADVQAQVRSADAEREAARAEHAAHAVAARLELGAPCPVCEQPVAALPVRRPPHALADADRAVETAAAAAAAASSASTEAVTARAKAEELLRDYHERLAEVCATLADAPNPEQVRAAQAERETREAALAAARRHEREARGGAVQATRARDAARARRDGAWEQFDAARDALADLPGLPRVDRGDLVASWTALAAWAGEQAPRQRADAQAAWCAADRARQARETALTGLRARCAAAGVAVGERLRDACADALARARTDCRRLAEDCERRAKLQGELEQHREHALVAGTVGQHLKANGFEQWLLDEALTQLTAGATQVLLELSGGQYSLAIDAQRGFTVVDHRNADERRSARTLSGGETFLASLALALTLASHLTALSTVSTPKLESIFLDEGFGSLDPATLDVVAAALEELGAGGRTVGLVTHVRELGERMPVRFEVVRGPGGASVERRAL